MAVDPSKLPVGQKVSLPGHFDQAVTLEGVRAVGSGFECRVRLASGVLDETFVSEEEAQALYGELVAVKEDIEPRMDTDGGTGVPPVSHGRDGHASVPSRPRAGCPCHDR